MYSAQRIIEVAIAAGKAGILTKEVAKDLANCAALGNWHEGVDSLTAELEIELAATHRRETEQQDDHPV